MTRRISKYVKYVNPDFDPCRRKIEMSHRASYKWKNPVWKADPNKGGERRVVCGREVEVLSEARLVVIYNIDPDAKEKVLKEVRQGRYAVALVARLGNFPLFHPSCCGPFGLVPPTLPKRSSKLFSLLHRFERPSLISR